MSRALAAGLTLAVTLSAGAQARPAEQHHRSCEKRFTVRMDERAADAVYAGTRTVTRRNLRLLGTLERCQRNPDARWFARSYNFARWQQHARRAEAARWEAAHPIVYSGASWYDDAGSTACGFHAGYGVAHKTLPCATRVTFYYGGRSVAAVVDDRGPFVSGREWDLNQSTAGALGFGGVGAVGARIG